MFTWQRIDNGRLVERTAMDYVIEEKCALVRWVDVQLCIYHVGMEEGFLTTFLQ